MNSCLSIGTLLLSMVPVFAGQVSAGNSPSAEEQQCLASALPLLQERALPEAEAKLAECGSQNPDSAILSNALGIVYEQEGRKQEAIKAFEKALALLPSFTAAQIHLGSLYAAAGNCDPAKPLLRTAAASTADSGALVAVGIGLAQCHELAISIQVLEKALQSNPASLSAAYNLALAHFQDNDFPASLQILNSLPEDPDVLFLKGKVRQGLRRAGAVGERGSDADIAATLLGACHLRPQEDYCTQAALELIHQEQFVEAAELLETALHTVPRSVPMLSALGLARFRLGRYGEAADAYSQAINIDPLLDEPREGLGFLLYMTGDLNRAKSVVEAGLSHSSSKFYLLYLRALILYRQSPALRPEAFASVSESIKENARFAPAYFLRGKIWSDQDNSAAALEDFQSAVKIDPSYSLPYYRMARIYSKMGRSAESTEAARRFSVLGNVREDDLLARQATEHLATESN